MPLVNLVNTMPGGSPEKALASRLLEAVPGDHHANVWGLVTFFKQLAPPSTPWSAILTFVLSNLGTILAMFQQGSSVTLSDVIKLFQQFLAIFAQPVPAPVPAK